MIPTLSCHTWAFSHVSLKEAVGNIARLGFRSLDLGTGSHWDLMNAARQPRAEASRVRRLLDEFDMTISDLYLLLPHINSPDSAKREGQLLLFQRLVTFAETLGTPGITVSPGILHPDGPDHSLARAVPTLQRIMDVTEDNDLRISFEPHLDSAAVTPEQAMLLLEAVPGLSLTLDIAHLVKQGIGWRDTKALFEYTAHVHIRQARPDHLQTPYQKGKIDIERLLRDLVKSNYHGVITVEYMRTFGWHGMMKVNVAEEIVQMRDALLDARETLEANQD
jgi:sugar phosphate isomerase/epimerase